MSGRPSASRQVADLVQGLMNALLAEENRAAEAMESGLRGYAVTLTERVEAAGRVSRRKLLTEVPNLLPTAEQILDVVGPPIAYLLAASREQTIPVIGRQLRACQQAVGPHAVVALDRGVLAAEDIALDLEGRYYAAACSAVGAAVAVAAGRMALQAKAWAQRPQETPGDLARRWCSEDLVRLPGAPGRGTVWELRRAAVAEARAGSVAVVNGLLLAGYAGWNRAAAAS